MLLRQEAISCRPGRLFDCLCSRPGQSHDVDPHAEVMVWNHGTPEWTDELINFSEDVMVQSPFGS